MPGSEHLAFYMVHLSKMEFPIKSVNMQSEKLESILWVNPPSWLSPVVWGFIYRPPHIIHEGLRCSRRQITHNSRAATFWCDWGCHTWSSRSNRYMRSIRFVRIILEDYHYQNQYCKASKNGWPKGITDSGSF